MIGSRPPGRTRPVRRSPHLVAYWLDGTLVACNYATGTTVRIDPFICEVLNACGDWTTVGDIGAAVGQPAAASLAALITRLVEMGLLRRRGDRSDPRERAMTGLGPWNPEAGFFHTSTRDVPFASPGRAARTQERLPAGLMPRVAKTYSRAARVTLPGPRGDGEFPAVLRARRTWRRFGSTPLSLAELATLLAFTCGVQHWVAAGGRRLALKTSPSGGARHALECYVVSIDVRGLRPGVYHYAADSHALERLRGAVSRSRIRAYVPNSGYFARASVMLFFTAVLERILWRYPYSRAYRAALVEAGHVCQTFCLTATWLGLAPFCVMGLADSLIERDLGLDGIAEPVLYAAGAGRRPRRTGWAPLPDGQPLEIQPNRHLRREV